VARSLTTEDLAREAGVSTERIHWLCDIGILKPVEPGDFRFADVFRVKLVAALLEGGFTPDQIEWSISDGRLSLDHVHEYQVADPGPLSERTFAQFMAEAGPRASLLPSVYRALGLPQPDPASPLHTEEEERLRRFIHGWEPAPSDDTLIRAARLIAEGTRTATQGWLDLMVEQIARPARERLNRGEPEQNPREVRETFTTLLSLLPRMMEWLFQRHLEQLSTANIVVGFEEYFAARGMAPPLEPAAPPAVVFVDLSGYTGLTEELGDEVAVGFAWTLQREAEAVAAANGGRLVKLLGDGAMLRFPDAARGLNAALALVGTLGDTTGLLAHAGVHAGPVIERDLDLFGRTVNMASRLAQAARPGEVLVSQVVQQAVDSPAVMFEQTESARLKGITYPGPVFRVVMDRGP
jgi:adenylate cyclase